MSALDAGFFDVEDDVTQMHIGSVLVLEGPPPPVAKLKEMVAGKLPLVPRYRQVARRVALGVGRPVWLDDEKFDLDYHINHLALPAPGAAAELNALVGHLMGLRLDRDRPLWELWMVEGLEGDRWAVVAKVHHCMVDGVAGVDLLSLILDPCRDATALEALPWRPDPSPSPWGLVRQTMSNAASTSLGAVRNIPAAIPGVLPLWRNPISQLGDLARSASSAARVVRPTASTSLNGPIGCNRRWAATSIPMAEIKEVRSSLGGAFNDVTLAAVTRGFSSLLDKRGEKLDHSIRSLVPVSVRPRDDSGRAVGDGTMANRVSAVFADLPVETADPVQRLKAISAQMTAVKDAKEAQAGQSVTNLARYVPPAVAAVGLHLLGKAPQRNVNTVTTNIPGPQFPLYAAGRRMLEAYPYVPIGMNIRIGVAMLSYDGDVTFGITGDYDHAADIESMAEGIRLGMDEMLVAAGSDPSGRSRLRSL